MKKNIENLFEEYSLQINNCGEGGKKHDAKIISELIFAKYGGEDMTDVLIEALRFIHGRNHFLPKTISID